MRARGGSLLAGVALATAALAAPWAVAQDRPPAAPERPAEIPPAETAPPARQPAAPVETPVEDAPASAPLRDPTRASGGFDWGLSRTGATASKLPELHLRGRILRQDRPPAALVEVDGVLHLVRPGDELTLARGTTFSLASGAGAGDARGPQPLAHTSLTLRIVAIDAREVRVELLRLGETITIR